MLTGRIKAGVSYVLQITQPGFQHQAVNNVVLQTGQTTGHDMLPY
jgi:hypothetical protein